MRVLGLDVGEKTIGLAASDALKITAQGICTFKRTDLASDLEVLARYVKEYDVTDFVVGHPKNMNGTLGGQAVLSEQFAGALKERFTAGKVELWDERLSTRAAKQVLKEANVRRGKKKGLVDKLAATIILQGYLDSRYSRRT